MQHTPTPAPTPRAQPAASLDAQALSILQLLSRGMTFESAANRLGISGRTARRRMRELCELWGVDTTIEAIVLAVRRDVL